MIRHIEGELVRYSEDLSTPGKKYIVLTFSSSTVRMTNEEWIEITEIVAALQARGKTL